MRLPWTLLLLSLPTWLPGQTPAPKTLTLHDVLSWKIPANPVLSPDGRRVAFAVSEADFKESRTRSHLWLADLTTGEVRQLTLGKARESAPRWAPDGRWLAFLANRQTEEGKEEPKTQVWLLPLAGGEAFQLTEAEEGVEAYEWLPDSKGLVYTSKEPPPPGVKARREKEKQEKFDAVVEEKDRQRVQIWQVVVEGKKAERLYEGDYGLTEIRVSPDGKAMVYTTNYTGKPDDDVKFDLWLLDLSTRAVRQLTSRPGEERDPHWSPDGKTIAFLAHVDSTLSYSQTDLFLIPASGGQARNLTTLFDKDLDTIRWTPGGKSLYAQVQEGPYAHLYRVAAADGAAQRITSGDMIHSQFEVSRDGSRLVYLAEGPRATPDLWTSRADGREPKPVSRLNPQLAEFALASQEVIRWKSRDGWEVEGIVVKPAGFDPRKQYPLIVIAHGGPHSRVTNGLRQYLSYQVLAARGYVVLAPNFRGSSGYTNAFGIANRGDLGGMDFQDLMSGVDSVVGLGFVDSTRIGITGGSYGGYMTNWAISQTDRFAAAISMFGIFNLITDFSNSYIPSWEKDYLRDYYWEKLDLYLERSPFRYVTRIKTPVLILHGEEDPNTFISNSKEMYTALTRLDRTVEFVRYPREEHGLREPNHKLDEMRRVLAWFGRYLKGEPEASPIGQPVTGGEWTLQVGALTVKPGPQPETSILEIQITLENRGADSLDFPLKLDSDVTLVLEDEREITPLGMAMTVAGQTYLLKDVESTLGALSGTTQKTFPLIIYFQVPRDLKAARLRVKDLPWIQLRWE